MQGDIEQRIGSALKSARLGAKKKQSDIAGCLGVSQAQVSKYEKGESNLTIYQLFLWANACGQTFDSVSIKIQSTVIWGK